VGISICRYLFEYRRRYQ